jgi:hypothetical protein
MACISVLGCILSCQPGMLPPALPPPSFEQIESALSSSVTSPKFKFGLFGLFRCFLGLRTPPLI